MSDERIPRARMPVRPPPQGALASGIGWLIRAAATARARLDRLVRGVRSVVTPVGWSVCVAGLVALGVGAGLGWVELVMLGVGLLALLLVAGVALAGRGATAVTLTLPVDRVSVGRPASVRLHSESARRRLQGVRLEVPVGGLVVRRALPALPRGGVIDVEIELPTERRGVVTVGPARTVRADPLGLLRREIVWSGEAVLHVHPRTLSIPALGTGLHRDLEGVQTRDLTADDVSFHALREYVAGDDRRFIHWRSSAKTGTFMVRQFEETRRSRLVVLLDAAPAGYDDPEEFELAVSVVGSLGIRAIRDDRDLAVVSSAPGAAGGANLLLPAVSRRRLLDALSLVETDDRAPQLAEAVHGAIGSITGASLAFLVTGGRRGASVLRSAAARFPAGVEVVAVECVPEAQSSARSLGGAGVFTIGYLEDLRGMVARASAVV